MRSDSMPTTPTASGRAIARQRHRAQSCSTDHRASSLAGSSRLCDASFSGGTLSAGFQAHRRRHHRPCGRRRTRARGSASRAGSGKTRRMASRRAAGRPGTRDRHTTRANSIPARATRSAAHAVPSSAQDYLWCTMSSDSGCDGDEADEGSRSRAHGMRDRECRAAELACMAMGPLDPRTARSAAMCGCRHACATVAPVYNWV
mmetsp:Transcript_26417/g.53072  ORF Transcript_26417/g.53072 Transcript_26417/m.53072 type:complete len:203 (+) Transcript_26417:536-1144(+)